MSKALYIKGTDKLVARLSDDDFEKLSNLLVKESSHDDDYYIDETVIGYLAERGAPSDVVAALSKALGAAGSRDEVFSSGSSHAEGGVTIIWRDEE